MANTVHSLLDYIPGYQEGLHGLGVSLGTMVPTMKGQTTIHLDAMVMTVIAAAAMILLAVMARGTLSNTKEAVIPDDTLTARTIVELILDTVYGLMSDIMGDKATKKFFPMIATCAVVILFSNFLGLVPGMLPPTESLNVTVAMAGVIFVATHIVGFQTNGLSHVMHMANPTGLWWGWFLAPLMFPIEIISHLARPLSLSLRLMCNMIGDHKVLGIFMGLLVVPLVYPMPIILLGVIVCIVQTAVFCLLSMSYIGLALEEHDHDEH